MRNLKSYIWTLFFFVLRNLKAETYNFEYINYIGATKTYIEGISNGIAVGYWTDTNTLTARSGFIYNSGVFTIVGIDTTFTDPRYPNLYSQAFGINSKGEVVGTILTSGGKNIGYLFDGKNYTQILPQTPDHAVAYGISNESIIVGFTSGWNGNGFIRDTSKPILGNSWPYEPLVVKIADKYYLGGSAYGISGNTIIGTYFDTSGAHGYLFDGTNYSAFNYAGALNTYLRGIDGNNLVGYFQDDTGWHGYYFDGINFHVINAPNAANTYLTGISGDRMSGYFENFDGTISGLIATIININYIAAIIDQTDSRITNAEKLYFEGGYLRSTGSGDLIITNDMNVVSGFTGTLDATNRNFTSIGSITIDGLNLTLTGSSTSSITITGNISGAGILINDNGNNLLTVVNTSGGTSVTGGTLRINSPTSLPTNNNYANNGSIILTNGGSETNIYGQNFSLNGNGFEGKGALILGTTDTQGSLLLNGTITLTGDSTIRTDGAGTGTQTIAGDINGSVSSLTLNIINTSTSNSIITSNIGSNIDTVIKSGDGTLTIESGTISSKFIISNGTLINNSLIDNDLTIGANATLKGSGTINGNVSNSGKIAPGNSPGVLTINGSYISLTGSIYEAQIGGLGGAGNINGHDSIAVTGTPGTFTIQTGAGLLIQKLNGFEATRGNTFNIYNASGGIAGTFSTFSSEFSKWMLLDRATGTIYGTGLSSTQNFSSYLTRFGDALWSATVTVKSNDITNGYTGIIDSSTELGNVAVNVLLGLSSLPGSLDPSVYASLPSTSLILSRQNNSALNGQLEAWRYERSRSISKSQGFIIGTSSRFYGDIYTGYDLTTNGLIGGMMFEINNQTTAGFTAATATTKASFLNNNGSSSGNAYEIGLFLSSLLSKDRGASFINLGINFGKLHSSVQRNTFLGVELAKPNANSVSFFARYGKDFQYKKSLNLTPYLEIDYLHSTVNSFNESGDLTALDVSKFNYNSTRVIIGTNINTVIKYYNGVSVMWSLDLGAYSEIGDGKSTDITSKFSAGTPFIVQNKVQNSSGIKASPRITYDTANKSQYYLTMGYEKAGSAKATDIQLGYRRRY